MYAYIGCRTTKERKARGLGISVYQVNGDTWTLVQLLKDEINPSYLCMNEKQDRLYSVHGDYSQVSAYSVSDSGHLSKLNTVDTHGTNPVHLALSRNGKWLYVANLQTGAVSVIPVLTSGSLGKIHQLYFISGDGGPGHISHPHQICLDRTGTWMFVPAQGRLQGIGKVTVFKVNEHDGSLLENFVMTARSGSEPRHCALHPNNRFLYLVNEKDSTVVFYLFNASDGTLEPQQLLSTLPEDYFGDGWASGIVLSEDGRILYVSNRKHDSISVFEIDSDTGKLTYRQNCKTGGGQPRFLTGTPDGTELIAANETTDSLTVFSVNPVDGCLTKKTMIPTESPVCVVFKER